MQLLKLKETVDFMKFRKVTTWLSIILIVAAIISLSTRSLNWGLDFTGGTLIEVTYEQPADLQDVRAALESNGYLGAVVQHVGARSDVMVRLAPLEGAENQTVGDGVLAALRASTDQKIEMRRIENLGAAIGDELAELGGLAMLTALLCILVYVALRFEWRFAVGSVAALAHDVILTLGLFSVLGLEFDLTVLAAVLAVIGYSLNDTIVVSDRIRENFRKIRDDDTVSIVNISLTQTLSRTVITSLTTILVLLALFFVGGPLIHGFATALLFGVFIGTYSSVYIASTVALALGVSKEDLIPEVIDKEGVELDDLP